MAEQNVTDMANQLAEECLSVQREIGNERLFMEVASVLGGRPPKPWKRRF